MSQNAPDKPKYSFDEFKLYYESTEKVTDRRLATNTWNYGICTAIMIAIATLANWSSSRTDFRLVVLAGLIILAGMGALLCVLWTAQIRDFKQLNAAKFEVLNSMAPGIHFGADADVKSATPFAREWEVLLAKQATQEVYAINIVALKSSNAEFLVPIAFRWLFIGICIYASVIIAVNWVELTKSIFNLTQSPTAQTSTSSGQGKP